MTGTQREDIAKLEALYATNPDGRVFAHLAEAYRKAGELEQAREVVEAGLKRHPGYASGHVVLGRICQGLGDGPGAEAAFRRVLELDPENLVALRALGDLLREDGRGGEALPLYRQLLALDPGDEEVAAAIGAIEAEAGTAAPEEEAGEVEGVWDLPLLDAGEVGWGTGVTAEPAVASGLPTVDEPAAPVGGGVGRVEFEPIDFDVAFGAPGPAADEGAAASEARAFSLEAEPVVDSAAAEVAPAAPFADVVDAEPAGAAAQPEVSGLADGGVVGAGGFEWQIDGAAAEPAELVTETMAEVYLRQGLYERAAEVYRALLKERPGDARLEALLSEAEEAARFAPRAAPAATTEPVAYRSEPEPAGPEPGAGAVLEAAAPEAAVPPWEAAPEAIAHVVAPGAWGGEAGVEQPGAAGEPIGTYLRRLVAWQPGAAAGVPAAPAPAAKPSPAEGLPAAAAGVPPAASADAPPAAPADAAAIEDAFNALFGDAEPAATPAAVAGGGEVGGAAPAAASSEVAGEVEDDDDLEMFRTWLQNLKR